MWNSSYAVDDKILHTGEPKFDAKAFLLIFSKGLKNGLFI